MAYPEGIFTKPVPVLTMFTSELNRLTRIGYRIRIHNPAGEAAARLVMEDRDGFSSAWTLPTDGNDSVGIERLRAVEQSINGLRKQWGWQPNPS